MRVLPLALAALAMPAAALMASTPIKHSAGETAFLEGGLSYALFEQSVEHVDLETCPEEFDPDAVFCRLTLANDRGHVFVFGYDGDQPLLAIKPVTLDAELLRL